LLHPFLTSSKLGPQVVSLAGRAVSRRTKCRRESATGCVQDAPRSAAAV